MVPRAEFAKRRRRLMAMADEGAILIVPAAQERLRSKDTASATPRKKPGTARAWGRRARSRR